MGSQSQMFLAQGDADSGGLELLLPAVPELIGGIIAFSIVFFFIWRWALPAVNRMLEQRQQAITGQLEQAENAKREAESLLADYKGQLAESKSEANRIIEDARQAAEVLRSDMVAKAEAEAGQIVAKARQEADSERDRALAEARQEVANLSIDLAERVVGESLDRETQLGLVERYLADLEKM